MQKSGTTNSHRTGLSYISYQSSSSRKTNDLEKFQILLLVWRKTNLKNFDFSSNFERMSRLTLASCNEALKLTIDYNEFSWPVPPKKLK